MQSALPFSITDDAKRKIISLTERYATQIGRPAIPAILWIDAGLNKGRIKSQPAVGFYDNREEIASDIMVIDGLEVVLAVSEDDKAHFVGKTLDYKLDRFFLKGRARVRR